MKTNWYKYWTFYRIPIKIINDDFNKTDYKWVEINKWIIHTYIDKEHEQWNKVILFRLEKEFQLFEYIFSIWWDCYWSTNKRLYKEISKEEYDEILK